MNLTYKEWVNKSLSELETLDVKHNISVCNMDKIKILGRIGSGGSGIILEAILGHEKVVIKMCNSVIIGPVYCRYMHTEIYNLLRYSLLTVNKVCYNFLQCLGYGINCCLNLDQQSVGIIYNTPDDILEYHELLETEGCDTFIIMNKIDGVDLSQAPANFKFTPRQTFELIYSYLCSIVFLGAIQADLHFDNIMVYESSAGLNVNGEIIFNDTQSLVHIDYQSLKEQSNLTYGDVRLFEKFIDPDMISPIKAMLNEKIGAREKIQNLISFFKIYTEQPLNQLYHDIKISF